MESMQNILRKANSDALPKTLHETRISNDDDGQISIYTGGELTEKAVIEATEKILIAFPKIEPQMIKLLRERFKANGFNDERMRDAVNYVIDNYKGYDKLPAIGDFIQYDKKVRVYTRNELLEKHKDQYYHGAKYDPIAEEYELIDYKGKAMYVRKEDFEKYSFFKKWAKRNER